MEKGQKCEEALENAATSVADFDTDDKSFVSRFHHALHTTPALVPLIVLVAAIVVFGNTWIKILFTLCLNLNSSTGPNCGYCGCCAKHRHSNSWY